MSVNYQKENFFKDIFTMNNKRIKTALQFSRAVLLFYKPLEQNASNFPSY